MNRLAVLLLLLCGPAIGECCGQAPQSGSGAAFTLPKVPAALQTPGERAAYVVSHYWDHFDFADTTLLSKPDITEQAFADYLSLFPLTSSELVEKSVSAMLDRALAGDQSMFDHFADLYETYLDNPDSPFRQQVYYIAVLRSILANDRVEEVRKVRPRVQLEMALKNRPGDTAADLEFVLPNGRTMRLSEVSAEHVILFFNNPDCEDCTRAKALLAQLTNPGVQVVALYSDEDVELWKKTAYPESWVNGRIAKAEEAQRYDLRVIPTLYLLDKDKCVVLKDVPAAMIVETLDGR